jgi:hypothetical protein
MAKRKVRDDADIAAAPAKKTKTSAKKDKKAADEDGMYIVVHIVTMIPKSALQTCCVGDGSSGWRLVLKPGPRIGSHGAVLEPCVTSNLGTSLPNSHSRPLQYQVQGLALP